MTRPTRRVLSSRIDDLEHERGEYGSVADALYEALGGDDAVYCRLTHSYLPPDSPAVEADRQLQRGDQ